MEKNTAPLQAVPVLQQWPNKFASPKNRLHWLLWCQAARLTKIIIALSMHIYIYIFEGIFGDPTDFLTLKAEKLEAIHGSLVRERGFPKWVGRGFLLRNMFLHHFYSCTDFYSVVV